MYDATFMMIMAKGIKGQNQVGPNGPFRLKFVPGSGGSWVRGGELVVGTQWAPRFLVAIFLLFLWTKRNGKNIVLLEDSVSVCLSICIYHWLDYVCIEWRR